MPKSNQNTPEQSNEDNNRNHPGDQPQGDNGAVPGGGGGGAAGGGGARPRDENALSFKHFLQPHSDVVPQPAPSRPRGARGPLTGSVDLVDMTMGLPDFVQDHLVLESLAAEGATGTPEPRSRVQRGGSSLDMNVLNDILPEFAPSQRNPLRVSQGTSRRRSGQESNCGNGDTHPAHGGAVALPDFLSDGPMQLNHNDSGISGSPSSTPASRSSRSRAQFDNDVGNQSAHGAGFEPNDSLRLELDRLRNEITEKNCRVSQLESELSRVRTNCNSLEATLRTTEVNYSEAIKRASDAEQQVTILGNDMSRLRKRLGIDSNCQQGASGSSSLSNGLEGHLSSADASHVMQIATSSENLLKMLINQMETLRRVAKNADKLSPVKEQVDDGKKENPGP